MTVDSVGVFLNAIQSGLVVSGNSFITVARVVNSGDALSSFRVSGPTDFIGIRLSPGRGAALTGRYFTEMQDNVVIDVYHHDVTATVSGPAYPGTVAVVQQRINDLKLTVSGATWAGTGVPPPKLVSESHPLAQAQFARGELTYRVRYLL